MTATDVIDGGIAAIKAAPRAVLGAAVAVVVPAQVLVLALIRTRPGGFGAAGVLRSFVVGIGQSSPDPVEVFVEPVIHSIADALLTATIALLLAGWYFGRPISVGAALGTALRRSPALLAAWVVVHVVEAGATVALVVPGFLAAVLFSIVVPVLVIEQTTVLGALGRSQRLVRTRLGSVFWIVVFIVLVDLVLATALGGVSIVVSPFAFAPLVAAVLGSAAALVTAPFVAAATTLLYLDLRVRAEGLDIELGVAEHLGAA